MSILEHLCKRMSKVEQEGIVKYWRKEADNYQGQKEVVEGMLKDTNNGK